MLADYTELLKLIFFQAIDSPLLIDNIPQQYREGNNKWFGLSIRLRPIVINQNHSDSYTFSNLLTYEDLAKPEYKNKICVRSSNNIYNQSFGGILAAPFGGAGYSSMG